MAQIQNEKEVLLCTHGDCQRIQIEDGEFCDIHGFNITNKVMITIDQLEDLRGDLCDIENKREPVGKSILTIDRIDTLLAELKTTWKQ